MQTIEIGQLESRKWYKIRTFRITILTTPNTQMKKTYFLWIDFILALQAVEIPRRMPLDLRLKIRSFTLL